MTGQSERGTTVSVANLGLVEIEEDMDDLSQRIIAADRDNGGWLSLRLPTGDCLPVHRNQIVSYWRSS